MAVERSGLKICRLITTIIEGELAIIRLDRLNEYLVGDTARNCAIIEGLKR